MAVLQMQRVSICALKKDRKAILEKIQSLGIMEMNQVADHEDSFEKMDTVNARQSFEKTAHITDAALSILDQYAPQKTSMFASLEGKGLISQKEFEEATAKKEKVISGANRLIAKSKEIAEKKANILKLENQIESLAPWLALDVPMNFSGTDKTAILLGTMPAETTPEMVYTGLAEQCPDIEAVDVQVIEKDRDAVYLTVLCLKEEADKVEASLRALGFAKPSQMTSKVPAVKKEKLTVKIQKLKSEIEEAEKDIKSCADSRYDLKLVGDYFRIRADKYNVLGTIPQSQRTFVVSGYAVKKTVPVIEKAIGEHYECVIDVEDLKEDEEPPIMLKNNGFSETVESIVASYGLPQKGEFDPTTIMSFFYVFFFGMMLSDSGIWCNPCDRMFCGNQEIPAYGKRNEEDYENVYVLWYFHVDLGNFIRWIFRECC